MKKNEFSLLSEDTMDLEEERSIPQQQPQTQTQLYVNIDTYENYSFESIYSETVYELLREKEVRRKKRKKKIFLLNFKFQLEML